PAANWQAFGERPSQSLHVRVSPCSPSSASRGTGHGWNCVLPSTCTCAGPGLSTASRANPEARSWPPRVTRGRPAARLVAAAPCPSCSARERPAPSGSAVDRAVPRRPEGDRAHSLQGRLGARGIGVVYLGSGSDGTMVAVKTLLLSVSDE